MTSTLYRPGGQSEGLLHRLPEEWLESLRLESDGAELTWEDGVQRWLPHDFDNE